MLIAPEATPPVVKVMDYGKHLFELKKTKAAQRKKQKQIQPGTEEGDYKVKLRNLTRFLDEGDKAKVSLRFRGREVVHPEIGMNLMKRIEEDLKDYATAVGVPIGNQGGGTLPSHQAQGRMSQSPQASAP